MPTKGHEGHDAGKPEGVPAHAAPKHDSEHPGYETQDVNVGGIVTFIAGLAGFILVFFVFCFFMGKAINYGIKKQDGPTSMWRAQDMHLGETNPEGQRQNLKSNAVVEQEQLAQVAKTFPTPTLETDDGNQDTADLHAREDLLLNYYSTSADLPAGTGRIPIEQAMALVVQCGLPKPATTAASTAKPMTGDAQIAVTAPLTDGFARTGYEQDKMEARQQELEFEKAEK